jgi:peptidoglycan/LPS O-acetylase OafA/YrhL
MEFAFGTVEPFATYLLFVQNIAMVLHGAPVNSLSHTWSLAVEEQFYMTLPFTVWLLTRRQLVALGAILIAVSPWARICDGDVPLLGLVWNFDALYFGVQFEVFWPGNYMLLKYRERLLQVFSEYESMRSIFPPSEPASFWMRVES